MDDIKSLFFTTEVIPQLRRPHTQQFRSLVHRPLNQQHQKQSLSPYQKLLKVKQEMKKMKRNYFQTLSQNHKLQRSLQNIQRKKQMTRTQFIKTYGNLKFKKFLEDIKIQNEQRIKHKNKQRSSLHKKKRFQCQLQKRLIKNQYQQRNLLTQKKNKQDKYKWNDLKNKNTIQVLNWSKNKHDTIKNQQADFVVRKSYISSALHERSKFNYMKKINKQISLVKQYENVINEIENFKIEDIERLIQKQSNKQEKTYDTFFMTTKNTISY